jgi:hypothetical protein
MPWRIWAVSMRAWDYPFKTVRIACKVCNRRGQYSKARFVEIVGRNTALPTALGVIAKDCPMAGKPSNILHDRCQAHYPDLITYSQNRAGRAMRGVAD